jgi:hypothetical protein
MAKGTSLFSTLSGKVGNVVAARIPNAADARRQSVRAYQPVVSNPKSYAQAEQRAKFMPLMKLYSVAKPVILRGQEGKPYGAPSRLAWMSQAMKDFGPHWFPKDWDKPGLPCVLVSNGSLPNIVDSEVEGGSLFLSVAPDAGMAQTIGDLSSCLLEANPSLKNGDQITFVLINSVSGTDYSLVVESLVIDVYSSDSVPAIWGIYDDRMYLEGYIDVGVVGTIILSRRGIDGKPLRSPARMTNLTDFSWDYYGRDSKEIAIRSYMSVSNNTDWAEQTLT